jgi:hypothetical protein
MGLKSKLSKVSTVWLFPALLIVSSCSDDGLKLGDLTLTDTSELKDEAMADAYFQDLEDMTGIAIEAPTDDELGIGRAKSTIVVEDHRFNCDGIVITIEPGETSTKENPKGVLTIDFGTEGCEDLKGNVRTGKLIFTYSGKRFMPGSSVVATTDNYQINDVLLEGTRTVTNITGSTAESPRFTSVLENGKATFPNRVVTRESEITWKWNRAANSLNDELVVEAGSWASGTTHSGREYEVDVLDELVYKRQCGIAVSGIKEYTFGNDRRITIDYGDGECDKTFTVTVGGISREIVL